MQKHIRKIIGVQSQDTTVDGDLTGRENVTLQGHFHQMGGDELKKRVNELLTLVGLQEVAEKRAQKLFWWHEKTTRPCNRPYSQTKTALFGRTYNRSGPSIKGSHLDLSGKTKQRRRHYYFLNNTVS